MQVGRNIEVDCIFTESFVRIAHLEDTVVSMRHDHMIEQLVVRLNEMDDMMDMVSEGTIHTVELKEAQNHFKNQVSPEAVKASG